MTSEQKRMIDSLRSQGIGYKRIAFETGISENTVKSYIRRSSVQPAPQTESSAPADEPASIVPAGHYCKYCGLKVRQNPARKEKKFCSDACRARWWNEHLDQVKRKAIYHFICPACGKDFTAYGNANRRYCCHACYIAYRFGGGK